MNNSAIIVLSYFIGYFGYALYGLTAANTRTGMPDLPIIYAHPYVWIGVLIFGGLMVFLEPIYTYWIKSKFE